MGSFGLNLLHIASRVFRPKVSKLWIPTEVQAVRGLSVAKKLWIQSLSWLDLHGMSEGCTGNVGYNILESMVGRSETCRVHSQKKRLPVLGNFVQPSKSYVLHTPSHPNPHDSWHLRYQAFFKNPWGYGSEVFMIFVPSVLWQIFVGSFFATQPLGQIAAASRSSRACLITQPETMENFGLTSYLQNLQTALERYCSFNRSRLQVSVCFRF